MTARGMVNAPAPANVGVLFGRKSRRWAQRAVSLVTGIKTELNRRDDLVELLVTNR